VTAASRNSKSLSLFPLIRSVPAATGFPRHVDWINLAQHINQWQDIIANMAVNFGVAKGAALFLIN
jgi:hypothetical protein